MNLLRNVRLGIFLLFAQLLLAGCESDKERNTEHLLTQLERLEGTWVRVTRTGVVYEVWKREADSSLTGMTLRTGGGDSVLTEKMRLFVSEDSLYYGAKVSDQNEGREILFTLKTAGQEFLFENPGHDFPQRIRYSFPKKDELKVVIEDMNGEKRVFFNFYRML